MQITAFFVSEAEAHLWPAVVSGQPRILLDACAQEASTRSGVPVAKKPSVAIATTPGMSSHVGRTLPQPGLLTFGRPKVKSGRNLRSVISVGRLREDKSEAAFEFQRQQEVLNKQPDSH